MLQADTTARKPLPWSSHSPTYKHEAPRAEASTLLMMIHDLMAAAAAAAYMCMDAHASCRQTGRQASMHAAIPVLLHLAAYRAHARTHAEETKAHTQSSRRLIAAAARNEPISHTRQSMQVASKAQARLSALQRGHYCQILDISCALLRVRSEQRYSCGCWIWHAALGVQFWSSSLSLHPLIRGCEAAVP